MDIAKAYEIMTYAFVVGLVWNKLYSKDVIRRNGLCFHKDMLVNEDDAFNLEYYQFVSKIGMVKNCEYVYYVYDGETGCHRYDPLYMKNACKLVTLREKLRQKLGWPEERIMKERNKELAYDSFRMCSLLFSKHSPLTIDGAVKKIQEELLDQPIIVNAILQGTYERDRMIRIFQKLVRIGNARLIALTFKFLWIGKSRFGNFYAKVKPFFRGDA